MIARSDIVKLDDFIAFRTGFYVDHGLKVDKLNKKGRRSESESRHRSNDDETEFWGYVDVRRGAHMFYWLYHSYHPDGHLSRPLIIWLQVRHTTNYDDDDDDDDDDNDNCYAY